MKLIYLFHGHVNEGLLCRLGEATALIDEGQLLDHVVVESDKDQQGSTK